MVEGAQLVFALKPWMSKKLFENIALQYKQLSKNQTSHTYLVLVYMCVSMPIFRLCVCMQTLTYLSDSLTVDLPVIIYSPRGDRPTSKGHVLDRLCVVFQIKLNRVCYIFIWTRLKCGNV